MQPISDQKKKKNKKQILVFVIQMRNKREKNIGQGVSVTFSLTQRKCTDRQNLLFSTLAPGMEFVFSNKALCA